MEEYDDVWMTSPKIFRTVSLTRSSLYHNEPFQNNFRYCTVRYNVKSCASRQICGNSEVT